MIRVVKQLGFELDRQKGSHAIFYRPSDKARVVIPVPAGRDIKPKTLHGIIDNMRSHLKNSKSSYSAAQSVTIGFRSSSRATWRCA
ncbi:MAG: type II toxin-antitoxin system HicA family toxin, partial [Candidatus Binatia bacterium]